MPVDAALRPRHSRRTRRTAMMIITALLAASPASLPAADTWDNNNLSGTGAWSTTVNWADDTEPTATDDVTLPAVIPGNGIIDLAVGEVAQSLTINNNYTLTNTLGGTLDIAGAAGNVTVASSVTGTLNTALVGTTGLTKLGNGTLILNSANSFSGGFTLLGGTVYVNDDNAMGTGLITIFGAGLSLRTSVPLTTLANPIYVNENSGLVRFNPPGGSTLVLNGNVSGGLVFVGGGSGPSSGTLVVNADHSARPFGFTLAEGILSAGHKNALCSFLRVSPSNLSYRPEIQAAVAGFTAANAIPTDIAISNNPSGRDTLLIGGSNDFDLSGTITDSGDPGGKLTKTGSNTIALLNSGNTYTGDTGIEAGVLSISSSGNLGSATNKINFTGGTLKTTAGVTSTRLITTSGSGGTIDTNGFDSTFGSVDGTESGGFTKIAAGKLTLPHVRLAGSVGSGLAVNGGTLAIAPNGQAAGVSVVNTLAVATGAVMDITDNHLIVKSTPVGSQTGGIYDGVQGLVQSGRNGGAWNGTTGIITSQSAAQGTLTTVGVSTGAIARLLTGTNTTMWAGQTINAASTMVMYTYTGDANLDGLIDGTDYFYIDSNVGTSADGYGNGDFNYDGIVDGTDYFYIDSNIVDQGAPFFAGSGSELLSGITAVPEPGAAGLILAAAGYSLASASRRRRR